MCTSVLFHHYTCKTINACTNKCLDEKRLPRYCLQYMYSVFFQISEIGKYTQQEVDRIKCRESQNEESFMIKDVLDLIKSFVKVRYMHNLVG